LRRLRFTGAQIAELLGMALSMVSSLKQIGLGKLWRLEPVEAPPHPTGWIGCTGRRRPHRPFGRHVIAAVVQIDRRADTNQTMSRRRSERPDWHMRRPFLIAFLLTAAALSLAKWWAGPALIGLDLTRRAPPGQTTYAPATGESASAAVRD
jgi:hypothetical protein